MLSSTTPPAGPGDQTPPDRRTEPRSTPSPWATLFSYCKRQQLLVGMLAGVVVAMSTAFVWLGGKYTGPGDVTRQQAAEIAAVKTTVARIAPLLESLGRLQCLQQRSDADKAGIPCETLLQGRSIIVPQAYRRGVVADQTAIHVAARRSL